MKYAEMVALIKNSTLRQLKSVLTKKAIVSALKALNLLEVK